MLGLVLMTILLFVVLVYAINYSIHNVDLLDVLFVFVPLVIVSFAIAYHIILY